MRRKYYAVKRGRNPGIYSDWPTAQKMVQHYSGAQFKSFPTREAAERYLAGSPQAPAKALRTVTIYTDGGSRNHGGRHQHVRATDKSAWAFLVLFHGHYHPATGGEWGANNNRMEILALVRALKWLVGHHLTTLPTLEVADSRYVLNPLTRGWLTNWRCHGWRLSNGQPLKNRALWRTVARLLPEFSDLQFHWTKGHATNNGNVFVDHLLNRTMDRMHWSRRRKSGSQPADSADKKALTRRSVTAIEKNLRRLGFLRR